MMKYRKEGESYADLIQKAADEGAASLPDDALGKEPVRVVRDALDAVLNLAPSDEGYCGFCKERVGNLLPINDKHHAAWCPIPKTRAALALLGEG